MVLSPTQSVSLPEIVMAGLALIETVTLAVSEQPLAFVPVTV
jgi:hypothetical protein